MSTLSRLVATFFFIGYIPLAPGTFGSIAGLLLYMFLPGSTSLSFCILILMLFFFGVPAAKQVEFDTGKEDNQIIVIDEVVGMLITLMLFTGDFKWLAIAFILFRLFDIIKPFPARQAEKLPNGWGVMLDDVVAGIYAAVTLRLLFYSMTI